MKNYECVMESEKKFILVHVRSKNGADAYTRFCELKYGVDMLEKFRIVELIETTEEGIFPSFAKIIRVREK